MTLKAILASLVLGSSSIAASSVAMAAPAAAPGVTITSERYGDDAVARDHHAEWQGEWKPPIARPITLAAGLRLPANSQTEIKVGAQLGRFAELKIDNTAGRTVIRQVLVQFANGQTQIMRNLDRALTGNECLTLDLDGGRRAIAKIVVFGERGRGWRRASGSFNLSAV